LGNRDSPGQGQRVEYLSKVQEGGKKGGRWEGRRKGRREKEI